MRYKETENAQLKLITANSAKEFMAQLEEFSKSNDIVDIKYAESSVGYSALIVCKDRAKKSRSKVIPKDN